MQRKIGTIGVFAIKINNLQIDFTYIHILSEILTI